MKYYHCSMEAGEEKQANAAVSRPKSQQALGDGASVTVELVGFLREQEELKSSQQHAVEETVETGFAIRALPFLIAEKNHHRGNDKEPVADGDSKKQQAPELGRLDDDDDRDDDDGFVRDGESPERGFAVRELASLIAQKNLHAGRSQQGFKSPTTDKHDDEVEMRNTRDKGVFGTLAPRESTGKKTPAAHIDGVDEPQGCESPKSLQTEFSFAGPKQMRIDVNEPVPAIIAGEENDDEAVEILDSDSSEEEWGAAIIRPEQPDLIAVKEEEVVGDDGDKWRGKEIARATAAAAGKARVRARQIVEREIVMRMSGGGGRRVLLDDDDHPAKLTAATTTTAAAADDHSSIIGMPPTTERPNGWAVHDGPENFALQTLSSLQRAGAGSGGSGADAGEASHQRHFEQLIADGIDRDDSPLPAPDCDGDNKNAEEAEKTTLRHPRWTREETAVLLAGKRKRDEDCKSLVGSKIATCNAMRRWDSISAYCKSHGVDRDVHQCRKRWSNLSSDYKKIRDWQKLGGGAGGGGDGTESYWAMKGENRRKNKLPGTFDPQMFADMDFASDCNAHKKKKVGSLEDGAPTEDSHRGGAGEAGGAARAALVAVLESNGKALQTALVKLIQSQIEVSNQNSELDRNQRKQQSDELVGVLGMLADSLNKIAQRL